MVAPAIIVIMSAAESEHISIFPFVYPNKIHNILHREYSLSKELLMLLSTLVSCLCYVKNISRHAGCTKW